MASSCGLASDAPGSTLRGQAPVVTPLPSNVTLLHFQQQDEDAGTSRSFKGAIEWVLIIFAALLAAFLIKTFLVQAFYIPSESMVPTLKTHDRVLVNKLSYR